MKEEEGFSAVKCDVRNTLAKFRRTNLTARWRCYGQASQQLEEMKHDVGTAMRIILSPCELRLLQRLLFAVTVAQESVSGSRSALIFTRWCKCNTTP
jgi:hypothetical protein